MNGSMENWKGFVT